MRRWLRAGRIAATLGARALSSLPAALARGSALPVALALCRAFETLGPGFVKLGQTLSVRPDLVGPANAEAFARLRDRAEPVPFPAVRALLEREWNAPLERLFVSFDPAPLGSASLAQVHRAVLRGDEGALREVAVKALRPGARDSLLADVALLEAVARLLSRLPAVKRHVDLPGLAAVIRQAAEEETDLAREGEIAERFARDFNNDPLLRVPTIYWGLTTRRVLTMEYIPGVPLASPEARKTPGYAALAEAGARLFFRQVLETGLFHADLHPSNLLATPEGQIAYVDFGIRGELSPDERRWVLGALAGLLARDERAALRNLSRLGVTVPQGREAAFAADVGAALALALGPTLGQTSTARLGAGILAAVRRHGVRMPHKHALLLKALLTIEGSARLLHADFDMEKAARDYLLSRNVLGLGLGDLLEAGFRLALYGAWMENAPEA